MNSKELRKTTRDIIELETSFSILSFLKVDKKNSVVEVSCKTGTFGNIVTLISTIVGDRIELQSPGQGVILIKRIKN